jgi:aarF domain-containing kinase
MALRTAKVAASLTFLWGCGYATYDYQLKKGEEGIQRSLQFWSGIFPIFVKYRTVQFLQRDLGWMSKEEAEIRYNELHDKHSGDVRELTYKLRGFYLKQAQIMSTQDDFVPKQYMTWVKDTQDNVPASLEGTAAREYARTVLKNELGKDFDEVFSSWDDKPIGAASIGQVHKVRMICH